MSILFLTGVSLLKWIRSRQHLQDHLSLLLNGVCFIRLQVAFVFPTLPPFCFSSRTQILIQVSILLMGSFSILFRQCSYPVILMKILMELQVRHSSFFSSPVDLIQALVLSILLFFFFQCFSYAGAPLNHPSLAIKLFRSAQDISKIRVSTLHSFKLFRDWYLIQVI